MTTLVIAFKYNDILYATSTEEFIKSENRKLLIICSPDKNAEDFPLKDLFGEVRNITYEDSTNKIFKNLFKVRKLRNFLKADNVVMSNPVLLITKLIFKFSRACRAVWVEDGLMNYYPLNQINFNVARWKKKLVQCIFLVPDIEQKSISFSTYLLAPEQAKSFWGDKRKINIPANVVKDLKVDKFSFLSGKKIFVGQPLYKDNLITIEEYREQVNRVIRENSIDYYLPHFWASSNENIDCEYFTLDGEGVTLEIISTKYYFEVFSISSTVLYSTKLLNKQTKTHLVDIKGLGARHPIILTSIDNVVK